MINAHLRKVIRDTHSARPHALVPQSSGGLAVYRELRSVSFEVVEALVAEMDSLSERMKSLEERMRDLQYRSPGPI